VLLLVRRKICYIRAQHVSPGLNEIGPLGVTANRAEGVEAHVGLSRSSRRSFRILVSGGLGSVDARQARCRAAVGRMLGLVAVDTYDKV
jgi:hypothetical protein